MRRILVAGVSLLAVSFPALSCAIRLANPVSDHRRPMGCPDPDVFRYHGGLVHVRRRAPRSPDLLFTGFGSLEARSTRQSAAL
jgi:hypothetical protein